MFRFKSSLLPLPAPVLDTSVAYARRQVCCKVSVGDSALLHHKIKGHRTERAGMTNAKVGNTCTSYVLKLHRITPVSVGLKKLAHRTDHDLDHVDHIYHIDIT